MSDVRDRLQSVCGFPARVTNKPCYHTASLSSAASAQVLSGEAVNLTTTSSGRPILTQLPAAAPRPMKPSFVSQPPARPPLPQQAGAQGRGGGQGSTGGGEGAQGGGYGWGSSQIQSQGCGGEGGWPSSTSSHLCLSSFSSSSGYCSATSLSSSSSSCMGYRSATAASSSSTSFMDYWSATPLASSIPSSSSVFSPFPPPSRVPVIPPPTLVPIFKNKSLRCHVNVTLLRAQKQKEQRSGGGEESGRVTLPTIGKKRPAPSSSFSLSSPSFPSSSSSSVPSSLLSSSKWPQGPPPPPAPIPHFNHRSTNAPRPKPNHIPTLSPPPRPKPGPTFGTRLNLNSKPSPNANPRPDSTSSQNIVSNSRGEGQQPSAQPPHPPQPLAPSEIPSNRVGDLFESKPKRSRSAIQDVDVEKMARSNQLSKVNAATLLVWLKGRGVSICARDKKEQLMLKVMGCLAEA